MTTLDNAFIMKSIKAMNKTIAIIIRIMLILVAVGILWGIISQLKNNSNQPMTLMINYNHSETKAYCGSFNDAPNICRDYVLYELGNNITAIVPTEYSIQITPSHTINGRGIQ